MVSALPADATEVPTPDAKPPAPTVYPLQGGKVDPNFENQKKFPEKKLNSLHYDHKNTLNPLAKSVFKSVHNYGRYLQICDPPRLLFPPRSNAASTTTCVADTSPCAAFSTPCFIKKTVPFVISLYLFFYKDKFHENPPEYTRDIGHYGRRINIRDSLTIL